MVYDIQLIAGQYGDPVPLTILDSDGDPDDLTAYTNVRLVIATIDNSTNVLNKVQTDAEVDDSQFSSGILNWNPTATNPVPAAGAYIIQVFRETGSINRPVRSWSLLVTPAATKV